MASVDGRTRHDHDSGERKRELELVPRTAKEEAMGDRAPKRNEQATRQLRQLGCTGLGFTPRTTRAVHREHGIELTAPQLA
jgi:hypothetical protein